MINIRSNNFTKDQREFLNYVLNIEMNTNCHNYLNNEINRYNERNKYIVENFSKIYGSYFDLDQEKEWNKRMDMQRIAKIDNNYLLIENIKDILSKKILKYKTLDGKLYQLEYYLYDDINDIKNEISKQLNLNTKKHDFRIFIPPSNENDILTELEYLSQIGPNDILHISIISKNIANKNTKSSMIKSLKSCFKSNRTLPNAGNKKSIRKRKKKKKSKVSDKKINKINKINKIRE